MQKLDKTFLDENPERFLLKLLAKAHVATGAQLYRFLDLVKPEAGEERHKNALRRVLNLKLVAVKGCRVSSGSGRKRTRAECGLVPVDVFFLTDAGAQLADNCFNGVGRFSNPAAPEGVDAARIYHNLIITEALLYACERFNVIDYVNENELKSEIYRRRSYLYKNRKTTGDFRVVFEEAGELFSLNGEVSLQTKPKQLKEKPDGLIYFTDCLATADIIQTVKETDEVIILDPLGLNAEASEKIYTNFNSLELKIIELFEQFSFALDASATAILLKKDRARISSSLSDLVKKNVFKVESFHSNPGMTNGRPVKFYGLKNLHGLEELTNRVHYYLLCKTLKLIDAANYSIESYRQNILTVKNSEHKIYKIVFDNLQNTVEENIKKFYYSENLNVKKNKSSLFVPANLERLNVTKQVLGKENLIVLFTK